jgi:sec-independent protein translocase protein TatA
VTASPAILAFGIPGGWEWILILVVVLVLFGNRIPGVARSLGSGINEFKAGLKEGETNSKKDLTDGEAGGDEGK